MKETDDASKERLEALRQRLPEVQKTQRAKGRLAQPEERHRPRAGA